MKKSSNIDKYFWNDCILYGFFLVNLQEQLKTYFFMKSKVLISNEKLAILTNRVTKSFPILKTLDSATMWKHPMEQFKRVTEKPSLIDTIILEENRVTNTYPTGVRKSQVSLACIYILLYYRNRDDLFYKQHVFPELCKNMGVFGSNYLNEINKKIDRVFLMDNALREVEEEKKKDTKPLFRLPELSEIESDELDKEFSHECLYRMITPIIETLGIDNNIYINMPQLWKAAKEIMLFFCSEKYPYYFVSKILAKIDIQYGTVGDIHGQLLMLCIYAMLRSIKEPGKLLFVITKIEEYKTQNLTKYSVLKMSIGALKDAMDDPDIKWFDDYDYTQDYQESGNLSDSAETQFADKLKAMQKLLDEKDDALGQQKEEYEKKINSLSQRVEELDNKISEMPSPDLKLKVVEDRKTDFIKIIYSLLKLKAITKEDGSDVTIKDAMKAIGTLFSDNTIANYSSALSGANNTSDLSYYAVFDELKETMQNYREESRRRKDSK